MRKEADFDTKKNIYNTIQLLADANSYELGEYFESFGKVGNTKEMFWNMKYQIDKINEIVELDEYYTL